VVSAADPPLSLISVFLTRKFLPKPKGKTALEEVDKDGRII
jgi:hypothetical protein